MTFILPPRLEGWQRELAVKQARANAIAYGLAVEVGKVYPGHEFEITVQPEQGTVFIDYAAILGATKARYVVHDVSSVDKVVRYCGEILERAGLKRGELESRDAIEEAAERAPDEFRTRH